ncbi:hypothetical protein C9E82_13360 [Paracoccus siganidrum]|uniref:Phage tail tape measure protein n=1 Tax=Paracoccus siganidrum TaxID=1276757 RepID=A0A419A6M0_9RHOB|nr:hypothetical protein D3P05_11820 [Paracoccus siganidrum]RMC33432.1 hypothetical protein C9E82_13360 [Paracoccus siganidrum]
MQLDKAEFQKGIDQAKSGIQRFSADVDKRLGALGNLPGVRSLQSAMASIGKNAAAALAKGTAAATVALAGLSVSAINTAGEIRNLSRVANATPEEFQGWAAGARSVGIEQEKLADILKDVNDRVGDFISTGGGPMKDFFEVVAPKVGVTADQFRKLSGPQALQLYVDTLEKANLNQQDFTFYLEAMASDTTALLPLLRNGGKQMQEYADRAAALGGVMSNQTVKSLASMKTALSEVGTVMRGVRNDLGAAFAPMIEALAKAFVSLMTRGSGLRMMFDGIAAAVRVVANFLSSLITIISSAVSGIWNLVRSAAQAVNEFTGLGETFRTVIANSPIGMMYRMVTGFAALIRATGSFGGALSALKGVALEVWDRMKMGAALMSESIGLAALAIETAFTKAFAWILRKFADLTSAIADGINSLFEKVGMTSPGLTGIGAELADSMEEHASYSATVVKENTKSIRRSWSSVTAPLASVAALNELVAASAEGAAAEFGGGSGASGEGLSGAADKAGSSASKAGGKMSELQKVLKSLREEAAKLKATLWMNATDAAIWENLQKAGVSAGSVAGREISELTRQIEGMKELKSATDEWKTSLSDGFRELSRRGSSFRDVLSSLIDKFADMIWTQGFDMVWNGGGLGSVVGGALSWLGIGSNANGTKSWQGGLTRVHERGGEILNLPRGTQIIPHEISKRMADEASERGPDHMSIGFDKSVGELTATMYDIAGNVVSSARQSIVGDAVSATGRAMGKTKTFGRQF